jgi:hypothetical protein
MKPPRTFGINREPIPKPIRHMVEQLAKTASNMSFGTTGSNTDADMNIQCWKATGTTPGVANTEFLVSHQLKHKPFGFIVVGTSSAGHIFTSNAANWTAATDSAPGTISLKSDQTNLGFSLVII